jgi:O-antigen/teichoic acid export membrane protein
MIFIKNLQWPRHVRYQRAARTSLVLIISRILTVLTGFITIPLVSLYLGSELFGLWMILTNFVSFLVFADLGVGIGFQNQLIRCFATNNKTEPSAWVANALLMMVSMAGLVIFAAIFMLPMIPWDELLSLKSSEAKYWIVPSVQALAISFSLSLPANLLEYIGNAYQRGYWVYSLFALGRFIGLIGVYVGCCLEVALPTLIVVYIVTPSVMYLTGFVILWVRLPWLRPSYKGINAMKIKKLIHVGFGMLGVRVTHAFAIQGPSLITASLQGLAEAGVIAVIQKILTIPSILTQPILTATQGAMGEAAHKKEWNWIKQNILRLTQINLFVFAIVTIVVVSIGGNGIKLLLKAEVAAPSRILIILYCIYTGLSSVRFPFSSFLTVIDRVYTQAIYRAIALFIVMAIVFSFNQNMFSIIIIFILVGELPQLLCTIYETFLVIGEKRSIPTNCP